MWVKDGRPRDAGSTEDVKVGGAVIGMMKDAGFVVSGRPMGDRLAHGLHPSSDFGGFQSAVAFPAMSKTERYDVGQVRNIPLSCSQVNVGRYVMNKSVVAFAGGGLIVE